MKSLDLYLGLSTCLHCAPERQRGCSHFKGGWGCRGTARTQDSSEGTLTSEVNRILQAHAHPVTPSVPRGFSKSPKEVSASLSPVVLGWEPEAPTRGTPEAVRELGSKAPALGGQPHPCQAPTSYLLVQGGLQMQGLV